MVAREIEVNTYFVVVNLLVICSFIFNDVLHCIAWYTRDFPLHNCTEFKVKHMVVERSSSDIMYF